jgi:hypothetical protein
VPPAGTRVRWALGLSILVAVPAAGQIPPTAPGDFALAADGRLYLGNATRIVARTPAAEPGAAPSDVAAPVAANGSLLVDERVLVGAVVARRNVKLRLLADVAGDLVAVGGKVERANQAHVRGSVLADAAVTAGVSSRVDGDLAAVRAPCA